MVPNKHIASIQPPKPCYLHSLSPCGRFLVGFGRELTSVLIYEYKGVPDLDRDGPIRFEDMFLLRHEIKHEDPGNVFGLLDKMALFFHGSFMLVSSTGQDANYTEPDGHWLGIEEIVMFHSIDIESGQIVDRVAIFAEGLDVSLPSAVSTYNERIVVMSPRSLILLEIDSRGFFSTPQIIGKYCRPDDEDILRSVYCSEDNSHEGSNLQDQSPMYDALKQRLLAYMYLDGQKDAQQGIPKSEQEYPQSAFYYFFRMVVEAELTHAQFIDGDRLLLNWSADLTRPTSLSLPEGIKAIYNIRTTLFEKVFPPFSNTKFNEWVMQHPTISIASFPSSLWEQFSLDGIRGQQSWVQNSSKNGNSDISPVLVRCQQRQTSPYLDQELFQYDEKSISRDRIPVPAVHFRTAKFIANTWPTNLKFALDIHSCLHMSSSEHNEYDMSESIRRRIHLLYLFHPFDPTVFCIVQTYDEYQGEAEVVNVFTYS